MNPTADEVVAYQALLQSKIRIAEARRPKPELPPDPYLFGHQNAMRDWMLEQGSGLLAAAFGMGKTRVECAVAKALHKESGKPVILVCPLGVRHQFQQEDGAVMGIDWQYVRNDDEVRAATSPYLITNYERVRDGSIDPRKHEFCCAMLDEAAVLRSLGSKTFDVFKKVFEDMPTKYVCTATPSPNNYREIIYYADFLGIMDKGQVLTRFFQRNVDKAGDLTINPAYEEDFWMWVAGWALFLSKPSELGFSDEGYSLPGLNVTWHSVEVDQERAQDISDSRGQLQLVVDEVSNIREVARESRETLPARIEKLKEILAGYPEGTHVIIWHDYEPERKAIEKQIPGAVSVFGSQPLETREKRIVDFVHGKYEILAVKPSIAGSGCNFQHHCHVNIFMGPTYKFHDFIQALHRTYRFQQEEEVDVHVIHAQTQASIVRIMKDKWEQHDRLTEIMGDIMREFGLSHEAMSQQLRRKIGIERQVLTGERFTAVLNDTVAEARPEAGYVEDNSVDLICTSVPFGDQYEYSIQIEDFGHNESNLAYHKQMDFLIPNLLRILKPGRIAAIHVKDRIRYGYQNKSEFMEIEPFSDDTVAAFRKHGFMYEGRRTIVTDVVRENNGTYRLGYTEMCKDATKMGCGLPEYLLLFRKPPTDVANCYADEPVFKDKSEFSLARWQIDAAAFWQSDGKRLEAMEAYDYDLHALRLERLEAAGALPTTFCADPAQSNTAEVWADVNFMHCLNANQKRAQRIKHLCPLPFDIVRRTIELYSNKGELVYDPFAGIGTVPYMAVKLGRRGYGVELSDKYFKDFCFYMEQIEAEVTMPTLFDEAEELAEATT